ncbi:Sulfatase domain-containing protein/Lipase_3 domain-containing protein/PigN domain-containing protein [Cephalotus follicularis]|uniref:GPI ethanolamine phosphate transferase 1 n=1 Tax=Cephalotus follicularis TaxID=3775 RepID=A0A1Q3C415_CEPFO|nr:Sulfatase domain-containing protein/Lipase_3 domain-containing protein/PigN domain-containing protein [Cephalotus follicularis]
MGGRRILGLTDVEAINGKAKAKSKAKTQLRLKREERWLVILGVILHAVYMLSIFDIYFKTPIVHGMDPVTPRFNAPAKRLVLLVADGLRADKFFEPDLEGNYRAPFLRSVIKNQGRWGVSHARPPTESRPGHVSIIAGFYEDPSAVTKGKDSVAFAGWKANPVEFDSVFNRSQHTFAFGSPDIVPLFCGALRHSTWNTYPHEFEDFATDASFLDEWSFEQFQSLLNGSNEDSKELLLQDNIVIFLHLLGCDSNGHAHRPFSSIYLNNVRVVDHVAKRVYNLLEDYFKDNLTAYIFTADHGMSDKGSHGDGHPSNTDTPLVAWGAGVKYPNPVNHNKRSDNNFHFIDEHAHDMPTPIEWGLNDIERVDVNQADIAPLMSTLLGLPCPVNSVGNLPLGYINFVEAEEVEAVLANTKQILNQFLQKSKIKQSNSFYFKPFKPLAHCSLLLDQIEDLISARDYEAAMKLSQHLRSLALEGLHYFQTYDWLMLMAVITLGYIGWIIFLVLHVLQSYTSLPGDIFRKEQSSLQKQKTGKVYVCGFLLMGMICFKLLMEHSPALYHAYIAMTVFLWTQIVSEHRFLIALWRYFSGRKYKFVELLATSAVSVLILEFLVNSFIERKLYTWCFLMVGVIAASYLYYKIPWRSGIPLFVCVACWLLSIFTLMPAEIPDNNHLVIASGATIIIIGIAARWLDLHGEGNKYWLSICNHETRKPKFPMLFHLQALLVGLSSVMVFLSTSHRTQKQELHALHQLINWFIAGFSMVLPLFSEVGLLARLNSIFLGFAPAFLLLSIGYEALFYSALALVLMAWILFENTHFYLNKVKKSSTSIRNLEFILENEVRYLQLSDVRIPLVFMVLFNVAFFGTGNFASIASFEISSVYRFITIFSPFLMAALLIFKLFIPFMLVIFCSGLELASFVVNSDLLQHSWDAILKTYDAEANPNEQQSFPPSVKYKVCPQANFTIIAFVTSPPCTKQHLEEGKELVSSLELKDTFPVFEFLCTKRNSSFSLHRAAINCFVSFHDQLLELKAQPGLILYDDLMQHGSAYPLIITGNSLGASIASLFTLWLLETLNGADAKHPLCITFGAPFLGDNGLQKAIVEHSIWNSCFLHVAANQDPVPRLFISPHLPSQTNAYKPFGTYFLCSEMGSTCLEDPEAISQSLVAMDLQNTRNQQPSEEFLMVGYGRIIERLKSRILLNGTSQLGGVIRHSLEAGISLQLEAIGVERAQQQENRNFAGLIEKMEKWEQACMLSKRRVGDASIKLSEIKLRMAQLEWYKKLAKVEEIGYYDRYKNKGKSDQDVTRYKKFLTSYWEKLVNEAEEKPHKERVSLSRTRWLLGGTNYRRMVEPLDIADYYKENGLRDYKTKGRSQHYKTLENMLAESNKIVNSSVELKKQNADAILTEDSCFWAHVEEALVSCRLLKNVNSIDVERALRENLIQFEEYILKMIKTYAVSPEIFLPKSSFMRWWREYDQITGHSYNSPLTVIMRNSSYRDYANGLLVIT